MSEKLIEKKLNARVKLLGGRTIKITSQFDAGDPDRLVLMPDGRSWFVELKSKGERPRKLQQRKFDELRKLGFDVLVIDTIKELNEFIKKIM